MNKEIIKQAAYAGIVLVLLFIGLVISSLYSQTTIIIAIYTASIPFLVVNLLGFAELGSRFGNKFLKNIAYLYIFGGVILTLLNIVTIEQSITASTVQSIVLIAGLFDILFGIALLKTKKLGSLPMIAGILLIISGIAALTIILILISIILAIPIGLIEVAILFSGYNKLKKIPEEKTKKMSRKATRTRRMSRTKVSRKKPVRRKR